MNATAVLAIESAIAGGSVALTACGTVAAKWHSLEKASRSEELLVRIADLLNETGTDRSGLQRIAVSNGPGSYTGLRIGLATAIGLARSLGIPCVGVSVLKALARTADAHDEKIVVLPIGRSGYCWQRFDRGLGDGVVGSGSLNDLEAALLNYPAAAVLAQTDAFLQLKTRDLVTGRADAVVDLGRDLAVAVALYSESNDDGLKPFYVRDVPIKPGPGAPR